MNKTCNDCFWRKQGAINPADLKSPRQSICTANGPTFVMFIVKQPNTQFGRPPIEQIANGSGYPTVTENSPACRHHTVERVITNGPDA